MGEQWSVYRHTFPNGKVYIGITKQIPEKRWANGRGYQTQIAMIRAINKYGWGNIAHEVLKEGLSKDAAKAEEVRLIAEAKSNSPQFGYNITAGGDTTAPVSEETRRKLHDINVGKVIPEEVRRKISETTKGTGAYWFGKHHSDQTKMKISESRKGKGTGIAFAADRREKIRKKMIGNQNAPQKNTLCIETGILYRSAREAARKTGLRSAAISECCRGVRKTYGGFHWKYIEGGDF